MTKTTPFGPDEEKQLLKSIKQAVTLVGSGLSPDDALAKVASDSQLHPDTVPLLVSAYNVGQQTHKREKCAEEDGGVACLVEPHPIARLENVYAKLYPNREEIKSAAQRERSNQVDESYALPPLPLAAYEAEKLASLAAIKLPTDEPAPRFCHDFYLRDVLLMKESADRQCARLDGALAESQEEMISRLDDLCRYFKQSADRRLSVAEVEFNSTRLFGSEVKELFDVVGVARKEARANGIVRTTHPVDQSSAPYSLVKRAIEKVREYAADEQAVQATKTKIAQEVANADPFFVPPKVNELFSPMKEIHCSAEKAASFISSLAGTAGGMATAMKSMPQAKSTSELVDDASEQLNDPSHQAEMRAVQARAMLADLTANDPIISGYDPSEITDAYNEIAQFSPNLVNQSAAMRGMLRQRLEAGVIPSHDAHQMAEISKSLRREPPPAPQPAKPKK